MAAPLRRCLAKLLGRREDDEAVKAMVENAKAESTIAAYIKVLRRFAFHRKTRVPREDVMNASLSFLSDNFLGKASFRVAAAALRWLFDLAGYEENPLDHPWLRTLAKASERLSNRPKHRAKPTMSQIREALTVLEGEGSAKATRLRVLISLLFGGFFRIGEALSLTVNEVEIVEEGLKVKLIKAKNNQKGPPQDIFVPRARDKRFCPVEAVTDPSKQWSYKAAAEDLKWLKSKGGLPADVTFHGLRGAAATEAIAAGEPIDKVYPGESKVEKMERRREQPDGWFTQSLVAVAMSKSK
uniref:Tyr recombinase domain-containing protein n=1 Tax=Panagrellus redivivus TaxID=6233 RepID=A0A7E4VJK5_PANRE